MSQVETWLAEVTPEKLAPIAPVPGDHRWSRYATGRTVPHCLGTVLIEEWAHRRFCVRDLDEVSRLLTRYLGAG